jgi:hypothetical protein
MEDLLAPRRLDGWDADEDVCCLDGSGEMCYGDVKKAGLVGCGDEMDRDSESDGERLGHPAYTP